MGEKIHSVSETAPARCWHFVYEPLGWACFTVNEATGEFLITSDWGNYAHRWNIRHLGQPGLLLFLAKAGKEYLMDKLTYEHPQEFKREVQWMRSRDEIRAEIIRRRREDQIDKEKARSLWEDADEFCREGQESGVQGAYYNCPSDLSEEFEGLHEYLVTDHSALYMYVRDKLIPDFQAHIKATVL